MVNKVTFVGFREGERPITPWIRPWCKMQCTYSLKYWGKY